MLKRLMMALAMFMVAASVQSVMAQESTGGYSGSMDVEVNSAQRVNDGTGTPLVLEDLDQSTVHNVLRQSTRPEAADLVWQMIEEQKIGIPTEPPKAAAPAPKPAAPAAPAAPVAQVRTERSATPSGAQVERYVMESETVPLQQAAPQARPRLVRGSGPQTNPTQGM